ncbi:ABC transporter permease [Roseomonas sp. OT10]|uniref:ABC transporter permease n=1 Tax=Roseomonas cutis TaxID=2897332 RepID=UPI001E33282F|nr:ABC transporter permease [Roseomonas sp. OT10]UFN47533.1 ABC transporter permease [Roseomonas sp. OT10]
MSAGMTPPAGLAAGGMEEAQAARARAGTPPRWPAMLARPALRLLLPVLSILALWYLAILFSGLPAFVIPRPERVLEALVEDRAFIAGHLVSTLGVAALGLILANLVGIGLAILFDTLPFTRALLMPAAITLRNMPYVALVTVLMLAFGDTAGSKVAVVALAGFFPVLVNTMQGLRDADEVVLDRMRILNAGWFETFRRVRLPYALPAIIAAQEIAATGSIIVAITAEWMISTTGLGYVINRGMQTYRGDQVYAVALLATLLSFSIYSLVRWIGQRLDWRGRR